MATPTAPKDVKEAIHLSAKDSFGETEEDPGPNPYHGDAIGTPTTIVHVNVTGEQIITKAGAPKANSKDQSVPDVTIKICTDKMCRLCFEPIAITYHVVSKGHESAIEIDTKSINLCGPKHYVPCEDLVCEICTTEAVAQRRKRRMLDIRAESVQVKRERDRLFGRLGNAGVRAWRFK